MGEVRTVCQLGATNGSNGNLELRRSNTATNTDTFTVPTFPAPAVNPSTNKAGHLYVAYPDKGENTGDRADVFLVYSTDGGLTWSNRIRVSTVATNDQWMPVITVHPSGTNLFIGWYDRRNDTNNSLIDVYGRFAAIAANGQVTLGSEFRISTVSFPPVFVGTLPENSIIGRYDPVYPPGFANLRWWYPEWPDDPSQVTDGGYVRHVGEYNGTASNSETVFMNWTDYRMLSGGAIFSRRQSDVRCIKLVWP